MRRPQLLAGFLLILAAAFVRHAADCGLFGAFTARELHMLLGGYGTTLLVIALMGAAIVVAVPRVIGSIALTAGQLALQTAITLATRALAKVRKRKLPFHPLSIFSWRRMHMLNGDPSDKAGTLRRRTYQSGSPRHLVFGGSTWDAIPFPTRVLALK